MQKDNEKKKIKLVMNLILGIVSIIATLFVLVVGIYFDVNKYEIFLYLIPMIIGLITGFYLLDRSEPEKK